MESIKKETQQNQKRKRSRGHRSKGTDRPSSYLVRWVWAYVRSALHAEVFAVWKRGWQAQLAWLMHHELGLLVDQSKSASFKTAKERRNTIDLAIRQLRNGPYKINNILDLCQKHVIFLLRLWVGEKIKASTINTRLSHLRAFAIVIGKRGLIPPSNKLHEWGFDTEVARRQSAATVDKSWDGPAFDKHAVFKICDGIEPRFGAILRFMDKFGVRPKEAIRFQPFQKDGGDCVLVDDGTKGGRPRFVPVESEQQRQLLEDAKLLLTHNDDTLSGKHERSLKQAIDWFYNAMKKLKRIEPAMELWVAHGLRHGFIHRAVEAHGIDVPVRNPDAVRPKGPDAAKFHLDIMEVVGHSRKEILSAYIGSYAKKRASKDPQKESDDNATDPGGDVSQSGEEPDGEQV